MSEHLKEARNWLDQAEKHWPDSQRDPTTWYQQRGLWRLLLHLESQNPPAETQQSEQSSAPTTGPVPKRWQSHGANLDYSPSHKALMDKILGCFKSTGFIEPALTVTYNDYSRLVLTFEWPTPSIETVTAGGHGLASPDHGGPR